MFFCGEEVGGSGRGMECYDLCLCQKNFESGDTFYSYLALIEVMIDS